MKKEIDTHPKKIRNLEGADNRSKRAELRQFMIDEFINPGTIGAEIGVAHGDFSARILLKEIKLLYLIDPWVLSSTTEMYASHRHWNFGESQEEFDLVYNNVLKRFKKEIEDGKVIIHRQQSQEAVKNFLDNSLDWVYIDGDHTYKAVKNDLNLFYSKLKPGGILMGDDYHEKQIGKAVNEFIKAHKVIIMHTSQTTRQFSLRKEE